MTTSGRSWRKRCLRERGVGAGRCLTVKRATRERGRTDNRRDNVNSGSDESGPRRALHL